MTVAVLGAGPHGRQLAELFKRWGHGVTMFDDDLPGLRPLAEADSPIVIGAAWPWIRRQIRETVPDLDPYNLGRVIFPGAQIGVDVRLGAHVHVLFNATVAHGCQIGDYVTICAGANLAGDVHVGAGALIGSGAVVIHGGITIGAGARIGAGAVVLEDVPEDATVVGVPAR